MGQAKLRGTFEQRQAEGIVKRAEREAQLDEERAKRRQLLRANAKGMQALALMQAASMSGSLFTGLRKRGI